MNNLYLLFEMFKIIHSAKEITNVEQKPHCNFELSHGNWIPENYKSAIIL